MVIGKEMKAIENVLSKISDAQLGGDQEIA